MYVCCISQGSLKTPFEGDWWFWCHFVPNLLSYMYTNNYSNIERSNKVIAKMKWCIFASQCTSNTSVLFTTDMAATPWGTIWFGAIVARQVPGWTVWVKWQRVQHRRQYRWSTATDRDPTECRIYANVVRLRCVRGINQEGSTTKNAKQEETQQNLTQHTNELQLYWNTKQSPSVKELLWPPSLLRLLVPWICNQPRDM